VGKLFTCCHRKNRLRYIHWISTNILKENIDQSEINEGRFREIKNKIDGTKNQNDALAKQIEDLTTEVAKNQSTDFK